MLLLRPWHALVTARKDDPELKWAKGTSGLRSRFLVTLTRSHRMRLDNAAGAAVYRCASAIRAGKAEALVPPAPEAPVSRAEVGALTFSGVEHLDADLTDQEPAGFFEAWWQQRLQSPASCEGKELAVEALQGHTFKLEGAMVATGEAPKLKALLHTVETQRILCLNRGKGPSGAETANAWFARRREAKRKEWEAKGEGIPLQHQRVRGFFAGEPVLFLLNDYVLKLFNGDHGVLAWTKRGGEVPRLRAVFARPTGFEAFDLEAVHGQMQRAYALTVHKAQGSQVDYAALLLPAEAENPLLVNQLVYTAVSRATTSVVIVGNLERLKEATLRPVVRYCGVVDRVAQV